MQSLINRINKKGPFPKKKYLGRCWIWTGYKNEDGYGRTSINGRSQYVHKFILESKIGRYPDGHETDHLCRVRSCVNPSHLECVPKAVNIKRGIVGSAVAARQRAITHCPQGHKYSKENTYIAPSKKDRRCRLCAYIRNKTRGTSCKK